LYKGHKIVLPVDSLEVGIDEYFINSALLRPDQLPSSNYPRLQIGPMAVSVQTERTYKENERNMPTAAVSVWQGGIHVGSWNLAAGFPRPVSFQAGGKNYQIVLQPTAAIQTRSPLAATRSHRSPVQGCNGNESEPRE